MLFRSQLTGASFSAGFIWWLTRSGGLLTSMLMGVPAWRHIDLLPVLARNLDEDEDAEIAGDSAEDSAEDSADDSADDSAEDGATENTSGARNAAATAADEPESALADRMAADMAVAALFERGSPAPHGPRPPP